MKRLVKEGFLSSRMRRGCIASHILAEPRRFLGTEFRGERAAASVTALLNNLDSVEHLPSAEGSSKAKLRQALLKPKTSPLSPAAQGQLDSFAEELLDILNEAISTNIFLDTFRGVRNTGDFIDLVDVHLNRDMSHITVFWSSDMITEFVKMVKTEELSSSSSSQMLPAVEQEREAARIWKKTSSFITKKLQQREPQFRSFLVKKVHFRKVPRIFFKAHDPFAAAKDSIRTAEDEEELARSLADSLPDTRKR
jgi:ribosome-binding factor A